MASTIQKKHLTSPIGPSAATLPTIGARDKVRPILAALQLDIVFGRLKPRERLVEEELSVRFDVGRHVVRSAIKELDRLGLLRLRPNRGAIVSDLTPDEVDELYEVRTILQREAASRIPLPAEPELIANLTKINDQFVAHVKSGDLSQASTANDEFHRALYNACGNRFLSELIQEFWVKTGAIHCYAIGRRNLANRSCDEHRAMIAALAESNRETFIRMAINHMLPALEAYKAAHGGWRGRKRK